MGRRLQRRLEGTGKAASGAAACITTSIGLLIVKEQLVAKGVPELMVIGMALALGALGVVLTLGILYSQGLLPILSLVGGWARKWRKRRDPSVQQGETTLKCIRESGDYKPGDTVRKSGDELTRTLGSGCFIGLTKEVARYDLLRAAERLWSAMIRASDFLTGNLDRTEPRAGAEEWESFRDGYRKAIERAWEVKGINRFTAWLHRKRLELLPEDLREAGILPVNHPGAIALRRWIESAS